jgi:hypothetical protein
LDSKPWLVNLSVKGQVSAFGIVGRYALYDPKDLKVFLHMAVFAYVGGKLR